VQSQCIDISVYAKDLWFVLYEP